jgi:inward rectifier potassium channel
LAGERSEDQRPLDRDLGLGGRIADQQRGRILNRDGTFNVRRAGLAGGSTEDLYHRLLTLSWPRFHALVLVAYVVTNLVFALGYYACGPGALQGGAALSSAERLAECFFFSVQTLGTIGYGHIHPVGWAANLLVTAEALCGLMGFAFATGLLFARFSRPAAKLLFSERALIAPFQQGRALMFRVMSARVASELTEVQAAVTLRRFFQLTLEREKVMFLPMQWVVVHPIDEASPLWGMKEADAHRQEWELLILMTAIDETFTQTVHARSSYRHDEITWDAKFQDMYQTQPNGILQVDASRLSDFEKV